MEKNISSKEYPDLKLVMLGDVEAGKTSLLSHYTECPVAKPSATIGVDLVCKNVELNGITFKAKIWDTAGTEKYRSLNRNFYKGAVGVMLVFDVSKQIKRSQLEDWSKELNSILKKPCVAVVGNKIDIGVNEDSRNILKQYCKDHKHTYIETSAKEGINVKEAFACLLESINESKDMRKLVKQSSESFVLSIAPNEYSRSGPNISSRSCQC